MTITADMIKDLRQQSGAGIMECKEALKESGGDMDKALDWLRKKGAGKAAKKADRATKEGAVAVAMGPAAAAMAEIKCETDFVSRNDRFQDLARQLAAQTLAAGEGAGDEEFLTQNLVSGAAHTARDLINARVHELGENIQLGRRARFTRTGPGVYGCYVHGMGAIGVIVELAAPSDAAAADPAFAELARDLAMHIAASNPQAVSQEGLSAAAVAKEREIFEAQVRESGKPENIVPKIVEGKMKKYYTEVCLNEQPFVKDPDKSVGQLLKETGARLGGAATVTRFARFQLGE
ncbi:MAG: elongation factor Ts [Nitrospinae bacterium]|nr:elongation factor Ts [Nitrospinota bacterium]